MNEERWKSFTAFAARVFGKPTFDLEEREPRLRIAVQPAKGKRTFDIPLDRVWDDETVHDETIIQYLPDLREALSETAPR